MNRTRIQNDINDVISSCLDISGIYHMFTSGIDASGIVLIIGAPGTPYHGGYYFFKFEITNKYPYVPPNVTLLTRNGLIRFHPAFAPNGKIKLDILEPSKRWSAKYSLLTIINTLYECLTYSPFESSIFYQNCWFAVCKMLRNPPADCRIFMPIMLKQYKETQPVLLDKVQSISGYERIKQLLIIMPIT